MTGQINPRFRLLIGWCCLMSSALLIITVYLATSQNKKPDTNTTGSEHKTEITAEKLQSSDFPAVIEYIRLIKGDENSWIYPDPYENTSLSLSDNSVKISVTGLYYIHAQVGFKEKDHDQKSCGANIQLKKESIMTQKRKLSEVISFKPGTVTLSRLVKLTKGDSISLNVNYKNQCFVLLKEEYNTYWEIILLYNE